MTNLDTKLHGIELRCDGELILHCTIKERPNNHEEMVALLRCLIEIMNGKEVKDHELN